MPKRKDGKYVPKAITIREDQAKYIEENSLNLSKFVQKKLDELKK
jgi:hypothetical protein